MIDTPVGLFILFLSIPFICLGLKNYKSKASIAYPAALVLIITLIFFPGQGSFPIKYSSPATCDWVILVFNCIILAYFLFVTIREPVWESIDIFGGKANAGRSC